jgi:hypothetical protein
MQNHILQNAIILFILIFISFGCESGSDRFSCTINGVTCRVNQCTARYNRGVLAISMILSEPESADISINISADRPGTYFCDSDFPTGNLARYRIVKGPTHMVTAIFFTNSSSVGKIEITSFDLEKMEVSGTFDIEAVKSREEPDVARIKGAFVEVKIKSD